MPDQVAAHGARSVRRRPPVDRGDPPRNTRVPGGVFLPTLPRTTAAMRMHAVDLVHLNGPDVEALALTDMRTGAMLDKAQHHGLGQTLRFR